jgi:tetratricopeptide (TPR) repeat protein
MMEHMAAADADAIQESLRIVNEADIYLGIFAYRYGYIPQGYNISITEMEYNRAGEAALGLSDLSTAEERLHHALTRARTVNLVEEELPSLIGLAELKRRQGDLKSARELLDDVWEPAERGPFTLYHADALNVLAQIERDAGDHEAAVKAAMAAYRLAWCDGPPFDESKYEPMPEVEIEPSDEGENEIHDL